jgi:hypothetical protein
MQRLCHIRGEFWPFLTIFGLFFYGMWYFWASFLPSLFGKIWALGNIAGDSPECRDYVISEVSFVIRQKLRVILSFGLILA